MPHPNRLSIVQESCFSTQVRAGKRYATRPLNLIELMLKSRAFESNKTSSITNFLSFPVSPISCSFTLQLNFTTD